MNAWEDLLKLFKEWDESGVLRHVTELDAGGRKEVAAQLPAYLARESRTPGWGDWSGQVRPPLLAGVACLGGAAAVTAWMFRREFNWRSAYSVDPGRVVELLRLRPVEWQADVARRIAARTRLPDLLYWEVVAKLVREHGIDPPDDDAFKLGWLRTLSPRADPADPLFAAYGPRIFEIDGLAGIGLWRVVETVMTLLGQGALDRTSVIEGVLRRLLRDGPGAPVELAGLHDRLDLDIDESARHARDYTALLPAGPVAVADVALAQLRRLEEAGRLEEELFAEALESLTFRPEKKLLRAALSWAGDAVLRDAGRADTVLAALSQILIQDTLALQERAVRLAVKLAPKAGPEGREAIRQAAAELPEELREKISAAYGGGIAAPDLPDTPVLTAGRGPAMPPPIASPEELARELAAYSWRADAYCYERLLAGLAEWSHRDPERLRAALRPWCQPFEPSAYGYYADEVYDNVRHAVYRAFLAFASPQDSKELTGAAPRRRNPWMPGAPERLYHRRALELVTPFEEGTGYPVLLATPTAGTGGLDPSALLDRLELLEAEGVRALPADLAQALLRLPRRCSPSDVERAARLTSEAGRRCAAWMRDGGLADPGVSVSVRPAVHSWQWQDLSVELTPPAPGLPEQVRDLFELRDGHTYALTWWSLVLPANREFAAAHLIGHLVTSMEASDQQTQVLAVLAHGDGPPGPAMAHALVSGMGRARAAERAAATDALLTLAARGEVPARELAEAITALVTADLVKLNRVVSALDDATQAGAYEAVWAVIAHVLEGLLPKEGERPRAGVADLLAAGARAARIAGVRAHLPQVAAVAARKGSSRLVLEARRLAHLIGSPGPGR
ncbi:DUF6493 family protein [Nonomuraea sp. NPDC050404]|uniref:DUF6493 family protein n=1 Tax=Nonomuraea sp. NPDC050404 TaxID=3155783 RepID=UPI0033EC45DD